jgi:hypothetical protein
MFTVDIYRRGGMFTPREGWKQPARKPHHNIMTKTEAERWHRIVDTFLGWGFDPTEADQLRRIELTLHRWGEHECNGAIERDEKTGKPYWISTAYLNGQGVFHRWRTADREAGALRRLEAIMARHPEYAAYHQTDPRGCALYIVPLQSLEGVSIENHYTRGLAVCV